MPPKVTIVIERRADGGLRVYSDDVPGLILSHSDARAVLADIGPALEFLLPARLPTPPPASQFERVYRRRG